MRLLTVCAIAACVLTMGACSAINVNVNTADEGPNLDFEAGSEKRNWPRGWGETGADAYDGDRFLGDLRNYEFKLDSTTRRSGKASARLAFVGKDSTDWAATISCIKPPPESIVGRTAELSAYLKVRGVARGQYRGVESAGAAIYLRADTLGADTPIDNMDGRTVTGTADWKHYAVRIRVPREAHQICIGMLLKGVGTVWADDFSLKPI